MKFQQLYSSSKANAYIVTADNGKRLLIECGGTWAKLQKALNYDLSGIVGCLVTHEHKDHSKAVKEVMQAGIDVYASPGTIRALGIEGQRRAMILGSQYGWYIPAVGTGVFQFRAFSSKHDAEDPSLYVVQCNDQYLLFATDTSHITQRFKIPFSVIAIECSYDKDVLEERVNTGDINESLAKRLLTSHFEWHNTLTYLRDYCDLSRCRQIHLLHLSRDNIDAEKVRSTIENELFIETVIK